jgi:hypothetical protein
MAWFCALFMVIVSVLTFKTGLDDANPAMQKDLTIRSQGEAVTIEAEGGDESVDFGLQVTEPLPIRPDQSVLAGIYLTRGMAGRSRCTSWPSLA